MNIQKITSLSDCHRMLNKIGNISLENISKLAEPARVSLREKTPARLKELAQMNCYAADKIKSELDKQYGVGNYVIISLGRSLSSVCELVRYLGIDVKHLPLSNLRRNGFEQVSENSIIKFKKYIESIGLTKDELQKNSDKKYILMDYTYYGRTLDKTYDFLQRNDMLDKSSNFIKLPISNILGEDYAQMGFEKLFQYSRFKYYAMVGKLPVKKLSNIFRQSDPNRAIEYKGNTTKYMRKLFWFNVFDSLIQKKYQNIFPYKEYTALYNHYLSPQAIQNYIRSEFKRETNLLKSIQ